VEGWHICYTGAVDPFGLGYAMGLIVGEGSFTGDRQQPSLELKLHRRDVEPLEHLRRTLGGRIFGPYAHGGRTSFAYMLRGRELRSALPTLQEHLPQSWKRVQFEEWRAKYASFFERTEPSRDLLARVERLIGRSS
jgi:hypothetical protein